MKLLDIELEFTTKSHLTVGSGENQFLQSTDTVQLRRMNNKQKRMCIPATTLKGVLRSSAVQIAHFLLGEGTRYCKTVDTKKLSDCSRCIICDIFGRNNKPSKIICEDLFPVLEEKVKPHILTQTSIERKSNKSKAGSLFSKEQIPPNVVFKTNIIGRGFSDKEELLLLFALKNLKYCNFGNGNGLLDISIKKISGLSQRSDIIIKLLKSMGYHERT